MSKPTDENQDEEVIESIQTGIAPESLLNFQPSEVVNERVADLIFRDKTGNLSTEEKAELDNYLMLEHLLRLVKAQA